MTPAERSLVRGAIDAARSEGYASAFADEAAMRFRIALAEARVRRDAGKPWTVEFEVAKSWRSREQNARRQAAARRAETERLMACERHHEDVVLVMPLACANDDDNGAAPAAE